MRTGRIARHYTPFAGLLIVGVCLTCAEIAPPPGGPADRYQPELLSSQPANGTVNVPPDNRLQFEFSERVVPPTAARAVFISPRSEREPKLKWKGSRLEITLPDNFRDNQTYVVSFSSQIADLRGNRLDSAIVVAFSTGDVIDSGRVAGHVFRDRQPAAGILVGLFPEDLLTDPDLIVDSAYPDYTTTTNSEGRFVFDYLPQRAYQLIAFDDRNKSERLEPLYEAFALPDRSIILGQPTALDNLQLYLTHRDTSVVGILSAGFNTDNLLRVRLTKPISMSLLNQSPSNLLLIDQADTSVVITASAVQEADLDESSTVTAYIEDLETQTYQMNLTYDDAKPTLNFEDIEFAPAEDKSIPVLLRTYPDEPMQFRDRVKIQLVFSEPLDTSRFTDATFLMIDGTADTLIPLRTWRDRFHLLLTPDSLTEGHSYTVAMTEFEVADRAGNLLGDSLTSFGFSVIDSDSLGAVSGEVTVRLPDRADKPVHLTFRKLGARQEYSSTVSPGQFHVTVPAGKYLLSGFIDADLNGQHDPGSIDPFRLAETTAAYPDTIAVRARFETAGIEFEFR